MRSGSQTFSRNQYAPIYGDIKATAFGESLQPGARTRIKRFAINISPTATRLGWSGSPGDLYPRISAFICGSPFALFVPFCGYSVFSFTFHFSLSSYSACCLCCPKVPFRAQSLHQDSPDIVKHRIDFWVSPFHGVRGVMKPRGCVQDRLTRGDRIDVAKCAFFNSGVNNCRA